MVSIGGGKIEFKKKTIKSAIDIEHCQITKKMANYFISQNEASRTC
jgi:hypothetical protein